MLPYPECICFFHLIRSTTSSLFNPRAWQSFLTFSLQVFFGLPLGLAPSTSYSINFFTQSLSSFRNTCPYHRSLFCCSTEIMLSNPSLSLNPLLVVLEPRGVCILKRAPKFLTIFWKSITWGTILARVDILKPGSKLATHGLVAIDGTEIRCKN